MCKECGWPARVCCPAVETPTQQPWCGVSGQKLGSVDVCKSGDAPLGKAAR